MLPERMLLPPRPEDIRNMPILDATKQPFEVAYDTDSDEEDPDFLGNSCAPGSAKSKCANVKGEDNGYSSVTNKPAPPFYSDGTHNSQMDDSDMYDSDGDPIPDLSQPSYESDEDAPRKPRTMKSK